jgi:RNA polymerase sigma factor (sigma-70 family)
MQANCGVPGDLASEDIRAVCDEELMQLMAAALDSRAINRLFDELFRRYNRQVARWCYRLCKDTDRASDLAQEVFMKVFCCARTFRGDSHFSTWLFVITRNHCLNRIKRHRRCRSQEVSDASVHNIRANDEDVLHVVEREQLCRRTFESLRSLLTPIEIRVLVLHHAHGMTLGDITTRLALSNLSGAKAHIVSARRKLKSKTLLCSLTGQTNVA